MINILNSKTLKNTGFLLTLVATILFILYIYTKNLTIGIITLIPTYASAIIFHYLNYKDTGEINWIRIITTVIIATVLFFTIL